jgi:hypothetical protein
MFALLPALLASTTAAFPALPATLLVGPGRTFTTVAAAVLAANPGDLILVDPASYPAFVVTKPVTIAGNGGTFSVQTSAGAPAITITAIGGTVAIDGASVSFAATLFPAISVSNCTGDVMLQNLTVDCAGDLIGTAARAAIEIDSCSNVILEQVQVAGAVARRGSTINADGANTGLSAVRSVDSQLFLRTCVLNGYDAPIGGSHAGDGLRIVDNGVLAPQSIWMRSDFGGPATLLRGGAGGSGRGGNAVHALGANSPLVDFCGMTSFVGGTGATLPGGAYAINNDGGIVAPGVQRMVPACIDLLAFPVAAPSVVVNGSTFQVVVGDLFPGGPALLFTSFGSDHLPSVPGLFGRSMLDLATATVIGVGTTPAAFPLTVPLNPSLAGLQLTAQAVVTSGSGTPVTGTSEPRFISIR